MEKNVFSKKWQKKRSLSRTAFLFCFLFFLLAAWLMPFTVSAAESGEIAVYRLEREVTGPFLTGNGTIKNPRTANPEGEQVLSGGEILFLTNRATDQQQLSGIVRSPEGKVIVIDGGTEADAPHLLECLKEAGSSVDAWLITHPQSDHVGGLYAVLRDHRDEIDIRNIYYHFLDYSWYEKADPQEIGMLYHLQEQLSAFPQERLHSRLERGEEIRLSDTLSFRVMNSPAATAGAYAVNSSGIMYDISVSGKHLIILGDMGEEVGNSLLQEGVLDGTVCDYAQLAHHGQDGVGEEFYRALAPVNCIWCTPGWLYQAPRYSQYQTWQTKEWLSKMNIRNHYCTANGDVRIR